MIDLHGQETWDAAIAEQQAIDAAGGVAQASLTDEQRVEQLATTSKTPHQSAPASRSVLCCWR